MATITANQGNFTARFATLKSGDTLLLADGAYGALNLAKVSFTSAVTIKGGTFSSISLAAVKGVTIDSATISYSPSATTTNNSQAVRIWSSSDVTLVNSKITGGLAVNGVAQSAKVLDATGNVLGLPTAKAVVIDFSKNVTIANNDISVFAKGIVFTDAQRLTVKGNDIHDLRTTPISGSVLADVVISGNHTWNSTPWNYGGTGDHGDRIHIWTDDRPATGIVITNNLLEQGKGAPMLGIYLDDNGKGLGFVDAYIARNTVIDGQGQGMRLENVSGTVYDNTLKWSGSGNAWNNTPRIQITGGSHDIQFIANKANVAVDASAHDLAFLNHTGSFMKGAGLSAAAMASVTIAKTNNLDAVLLQLGIDANSGMAVSAAAFSSDQALRFAGFDLAGKAAMVELQAVHIG